MVPIPRLLRRSKGRDPDWMTAATQLSCFIEDGGATSMARGTAGTMLQAFEAVKDTIGLDISKMLKAVSTVGLVGKAAPESPE